MPAADWLSDQFLLSVKRRGNISTSTDGWSDSDLLTIATDEARDSIIPWLRGLSEEFLVVDYDQNIVASTSAYSLPSWAIGEILRDVQLADGSGGFISLNRKEPSDVSPRASQNRPDCYFLRDNKVVLVPTPSSALTNGLRLRCVARPSKMVPISEAYTLSHITDTTANANNITGSATAASVLGGSVTVDIVQAAPGFRTLGRSIIASISSNAITWSSGGFTTAAPGVAAGDYVVLVDRSPAPQLPNDLHPLLAQATVCAYLRGSGQPGLEAAEREFVKLETALKRLLSPRTENQPRFIKNKYGVR